MEEGNGDVSRIDKVTLRVAEPERPSRKPLSERRDSHGPARYLSPSPTPHARFSPEPPHAYHEPPLEQQEWDPSYEERPRGSPVRRFWSRNKGACLVALSQFFGALMNVSARFLEVEGNGMHPVQVLLVRQSLTAVVCLGYMWWTSVPSAPLGSRDVRPLLLIRGVVGFFGIFGFAGPPSPPPRAAAVVNR